MGRLLHEPETVQALHHKRG